MYNSKYKYLINGKRNFYIKKDNDDEELAYEGLYTWSYDKSEVSDFLKFRKSAEKMYSVKKINLSSGEKEKFYDTYGEIRIIRTVLETMRSQYEPNPLLRKTYDVCISREEYVNVSEYGYENIFEFIDNGLYNKSSIVFNVFKDKYIDSLDHLCYTSNSILRAGGYLPFNSDTNISSLISEMGLPTVDDKCEYNSSYGKTFYGRDFSMKYYESQIVTFWLLYKEIII